jgi:hypothetical protein
MHLNRLARFFACLILAGASGGSMAWAADAPDLKAQAEAGLKVIAATEYWLLDLRGHFASGDELVEAKNVNVGSGLEGLLLAKPDTGIYYNIAASKDGRHFIAVATFGRDSDIIYIDETGTINSSQKEGSAQRMIDRQFIADFFTSKTQWASQAEAILKLQLHQVQLAVERWSTDHSAAGKSVYPETLEPVVSEGYLPAGFYVNPVTAWSVDDNNALAVPLGQWSPGDFSYFPHTRDGEYRGYLLVGYGCKRTAGIDYNGDGVGDGMAIVLASWDGGPAWYEDVLRQLH